MTGQHGFMFVYMHVCVCVSVLVGFFDQLHEARLLSALAMARACQRVNCPLCGRLVNVADINNLKIQQRKTAAARDCDVVWCGPYTHKVVLAHAETLFLLQLPMLPLSLCFYPVNSKAKKRNIIKANRIDAR
jgi:hypothetical protein